MPARQSPELLQAVTQGFHVGDRAAIRDDRERFEAEINADHWTESGVWLWQFVIYLDADIPAPSVFRNRRLRDFRADRQIGALFQPKHTQARKLDALFKDVDSACEAEAAPPF